MHVEDLGTWPKIAEIRGKKSKRKTVEDWSMDNGEERERTNIETI